MPKSRTTALEEDGAGDDGTALPVSRVVLFGVSRLRLSSCDLTPRNRRLAPLVTYTSSSQGKFVQKDTKQLTQFRALKQHRRN